jgi:uncharacterized protein YifN (PemK superfamily)
MPIVHIPAAGDVLMCDYGPDPMSIAPPGVMKGPLAVPPEIFKFRPVAVLASNNKLSVVVPFSTSVPKHPRPYHVHIPVGTYQFLTSSDDSWLKADLIEAVSHQRLDRPFVAGRYGHANLTVEHRQALRVACLNALQLGSLAKHL